MAADIIISIIVPCRLTSDRYWFVRGEQLGADEHRVQPGDQEEQQHRDEVLKAHDLVVGAEPEVAPRALLLLLAQRGRPADQAAERVVREAEADQPAEQREDEAHEDRDVVLIGRELGVHPDRDPRPDPVPEEPPAHP
jgi:hypothetical protein